MSRTRKCPPTGCHRIRTISTEHALAIDVLNETLCKQDVCLLFKLLTCLQVLRVLRCAIASATLLRRFNSKVAENLLLVAATTAVASLSVVVVALVAAFFAVTTLVLGVAIAWAHSEGSGGETVGEVDLGADCVSEVGYEEDVLDVVVARTKVSERTLCSMWDATYKSFSISSASTFGAKERVFIKNWPSAELGSASSSSTFET